MSFLPAVQSEIVKRAEGDPIRVTLEYLRLHAVGRKNAVTINKVLKHMESLGIEMKRQSFQHAVLSPSRASGWFIGSGKSGIFLIDEEADAAVMKAFYQERIASEKKHLDQLLLESARVGWSL